MPDNEPKPQSDLASFGEELRREREIRGISLKEIADATKISKRFLEAIEHNDHKTLPAPVFTRGFVREYARYLGLNADDMVSRYNYAAAGDERIEQSAHLDRLVQPAAANPREGTGARESNARPRGIPPPYARVDRNIYFLVLIVAALGAVTWWAIRHKREGREAEVARPPVAAAATPAAASPKPAPPAATNPDDGMLHLTIDLTGDSWVSLDADGKSVFNESMQRGQRHTFDARERFRFRTIGNAAGLDLTINGVRIPSLGREGQVLHDRVFDREALEKLKTAAVTQTTGSAP
jgi:transcriptional regulator with XRE-family HTH domain